MKSPFVTPSDPILTQTAEPISFESISSEEIKNIVTRMTSIALGEQKDISKPVLVGLAAPQIGINKQIILVDTHAAGKGEIGNLEILFNPIITYFSKDIEEWYEGCFSTGRVCGIVARSSHIKINAYNSKAHKIEKKFSGYTARIIQHEVDHLLGRVFVDYITDPEKLHWVEEKEFGQYRNNQAWRNWMKKCSFSQWKQIKNGGII